MIIILLEFKLLRNFSNSMEEVLILKLSIIPSTKEKEEQLE